MPGIRNDNKRKARANLIYLFTQFLVLSAFGSLKVISAPNLRVRRKREAL